MGIFSCSPPTGQIDCEAWVPWAEKVAQGQSNCPFMVGSVVREKPGPGHTCLLRNRRLAEQRHTEAKGGFLYERSDSGLYTDGTSCWLSK